MVGKSKTCPQERGEAPQPSRKNCAVTEAEAFQHEFKEYLEAHGFEVRLEVHFHYATTYGARQGRIDVLATDPKDGYTIAYELDNYKPRTKSIDKLQHYPANEAWVICRTMKATRIK